MRPTTSRSRSSRAKLKTAKDARPAQDAVVSNEHSVSSDTATSLFELVEKLVILLSEISIHWSVLREEHDVGPRGVWIVRLIAAGEIYASSLARAMATGRSVMTYELKKLEAAGLISQTKATHDARRVKLALSAAGEKLLVDLDELHHALFGPALLRYSPEETRICLDVLEGLAECAARRRLYGKRD